MSPRDRKLPDFGAPPVVETVVGFSFAPLVNWDLRHFGLFAEFIRADYPGFQVQPPIAEAEEATSRVGLANLIVRAVGVTEPPVRCWFIDQTRTRLLQLQLDRFLHNWRKVSGDEAYPRYDDEIRPRFVREWERFRTFLREHSIEEGKARGWEVTYVNHLERGREWNSLADLAGIIRWWNAKFEGEATDTPERLVLDLAFQTDPKTRLAISLRSGVRQRDKHDVLVFNLTARGSAGTFEEALEGVDRGRATIVNAFTEITTDQMHRLWQRRTWT